MDLVLAMLHLSSICSSSCICAFGHICLGVFGLLLGLFLCVGLGWAEFVEFCWFRLIQAFWVNIGKLQVNPSMNIFLPTLKPGVLSRLHFLG